jgi:murein L,D-transpeptidase YafK
MVTAALENGQPRFAVHVFPFRMTDRNLRLRRGQKWESFWADLKQGYDLFEQSGVPPTVSVCEGRYASAPGDIASETPVIEARCPAEVAGNQ